MQSQRSTKERRPLSKRPLKKKLEGKTFFLDNVKKQQIILLDETIQALGGRVESFLHKDVDYVVTGSKEHLKQENPTAAKGAVKDKGEGDKRPAEQQERGLAPDKRPGTPRPAACGSRGKALLEKAIRNNDRLQASSVLSSARSWGVKILSVDHALLYLKKLTKERCTAKQCLPVVKATVLNTPYLKIEDVSRKYKPLFTLYVTLPALCQLSKSTQQSLPPPPWFEQWAEQGESKTRHKKAESSPQDNFQTSYNLPWLIGKKNSSYCECCQHVFTSLKEHLQSDQHHRFAMDQSNYSTVDQVVAEMAPAFDSTVFQQSEEAISRPPSPLPVEDFCGLEFRVEESKQAEEDFFFNTVPVDLPLSASPGVQLTEPKEEDVTTEMNSVTPQTPSQFHNNPTPALSPANPVSNIQPQDQGSPSQQPKAQHPSSGPGEPFSPHDASSLPPFLSPEIPYPCYVMDLHSSYSDPPILSPQHCTAEETAVQGACDMNFVDTVSEFISAVPLPASSSPLVSVTLANTEGVDGKSRDESTGLSCANGRSDSVPQLSATTRNPRKRRHSASSKHNSRKRRRTSPSGCASTGTLPILDSTRLQCDDTRGFEECLAPPQITQPHSVADVSLIYTPCTSDILGSQQTRTTCPCAHAQTKIDSFAFGSPHLLPSKAVIDPPLDLSGSRDAQRSQPHATPVCIEQSLIPDPAALTPSSSDSEWDCGLLSRLGPPSAVCLMPAAQSCELDKELLHRPCPWTYDNGYESHLHTILQQSTPCADEKDISSFSRSVVQIAEVQ